jgi:hypothetical protein
MSSTIRSTLCTLVTLATRLTLARDWDSPPYNYLYQFEMPIAPVKQPLRTFTFPNGPPIDYFEVDIKPFESQIYPTSAKHALSGMMVKLLIRLSWCNKDVKRYETKGWNSR